MAQALLLPSLYEACPSPAIEAMASGCPVVTSNRYGTKEIVQNAAVLVDPEDVDNIADGMRQVTTDREWRAKLIAAGYARARDFDWEKCAEETLGFLERTHREAPVGKARRRVNCTGQRSARREGERPRSKASS
jgi:glycosyltransferase involved in cell wall biosynthesis